MRSHPNRAADPCSRHGHAGTEPKKWHGTWEDAFQQHKQASALEESTHPHPLSLVFNNLQALESWMVMTIQPREERPKFARALGQTSVAWSHSLE